MSSQSAKSSKLITALTPAAALFYAAFGLEILFMISPVGLYFYVVYGPMLSILDSWAGTAWLTQFFLPHLSVTRSALLNALRWVGGVATAGGSLLFLGAALQLYRAKWQCRGAVTNGFYRLSRHPQYIGLALLGLGATLLWPRFLVLLAYLSMLTLYRALAMLEEKRCEARFGEPYRHYLKRMKHFALSGPPIGARRNARTTPSRRFARGSLRIAVTFFIGLGLAFALREYSLARITALYQDRVAILSPALLKKRELQAAYRIASSETGVRKAMSWTEPLLVHVLPKEWHLADLPIDSGKIPGGGHQTPAHFDRRHYTVLFSRPRSYAVHPTGKAIVRSAYGLQPLRQVVVDIESGLVESAAIPPSHVRWGNIPTPIF